MRYYCFACWKSVTSPLPDDAVIRATLICPECIERADPSLVEALEDIAQKVAADTNPKHQED
jgi:DNA-directed RNA polymerase subunit RPC12/RpoP